MLPLVELRADFSISLEELRDNDRGAFDADLEPLDRAARQIAIAENVAVFHGWSTAGIGGIAEVAAVELAAARREAPTDTRARSRARSSRCARSGSSGPYGLALGPDEYTAVIETAEHGGYPLFDHLAKILDGPIVWAPGVKGAVVLSLRGGDFLFGPARTSRSVTATTTPTRVHLYLEESFSFVVATPEAAAAATRSSAPRPRPRLRRGRRPWGRAT